MLIFSPKGLCILIFLISYFLALIWLRYLVAQWMGSSDYLVFYVHLLLQKTKVPELSPEEADYFWSQPSEKFLSSGKSIRHWTSGLYLQISDWLRDPRIGPSLLLAAMISFSFIWLNLNRSQSTQPSNRDESSQSRVKVSASVQVNSILLLHPFAMQTK